VLLPAGCLLGAALFVGCSGNDKNAVNGPPGARSAGTGPGVTLVTRGRVIRAIAIDAKRLAWASGPFEGEGGPTWIFTREAPRATVRRLAIVDPVYGLAAAAGWTVFAQAAETGEKLLARKAGSTILLTRSLAAPIASRRQFVAWAEQTKQRQRVVVRDLQKSVDWVAAALPNCQRGRCYRIDRVALADAGVVFTRVRIGSDASVIVRRAFASSRPDVIELSDDPQPDLAPSSAGALYYHFRRGWFRWDFGKQHPEPASELGTAPAPFVEYDRGRWFFARQTGCRWTLETRTAGGRTATVFDQRLLHGYFEGNHEHMCHELTGVAGTRGRLISSWTLRAQEAHHGSDEHASEKHEEEGIVGVINVTNLPH
jgi:hypothetical protein